MEEWKEYKLGDYILDIAAGPFGSNLKVECFVPSGFPIIDGANLRGFKVTDNVTKFVTEEKARSLYRSIAKRNDVVVTISGNVGQISYIPFNSKYKEYLVSQRQFRVTFDTTKVYVPYLIYYFHTIEGQHKILSFANQTGVPALAQPLKNFKNIDVQLPPLSKQKQIASILSSLDDKIDCNRRINDNLPWILWMVHVVLLLLKLKNDNLEQQAQALFKSWFVDFEPFKGGEFVESEMGLIPKGWKVGLLSEIGEIVGGSTPSKAKSQYYTSNGIPWLTPKDLSNSPCKFTAKGEIDITKEGYASCSTKIMPKGTVLFSSRAPIGYVSIAKNEICTNQGFKSVVPKEAGTAFIYYFLKTSTKDIENKATGSTFKEASGALMKSLPTIIPTKSVLYGFEQIMEPIFRKQETIEDESRRLAQLRDTLLPKLMSGELKVNEL